MLEQPFDSIQSTPATHTHTYTHTHTSIDNKKRENTRHQVKISHDFYARQLSSDHLEATCWSDRNNPNLSFSYRFLEITAYMAA